MEAAMAAVDPIQFLPLRKFFPELTEIQSVHVCLLVFGQLSVEELAELRDIAPNTVKESISSVQKKLGVSSMKLLRTFVMGRVLMHIALYLFKDD
jgi:DNA-binding NarL/FixJ family response regulator